MKFYLLVPERKLKVARDRCFRISVGFNDFLESQAGVGEWGPQATTGIGRNLRASITGDLQFL